MREYSTKEITSLAVMIGLVTVASYFGIRWPFSAGGYTHLGTLVALIIAIKYGKVPGAIAGGVGMFLFDLFSDYTAWMWGTLVVRLLVGFVVGYIAYDNKIEKQGTNPTRNFIAILVGMVIMLAGYYLFEAIFLTTFKSALASITGNVLQFVIGLLALYIVPKLILIEDQQAY